MNWVRCPKCRTVNDVDRYAVCDGCNGDLPDQSGPTILTPAVRNQVRSDGKGILIVLFILGILSAIAVFGALHSTDEEGLIVSLLAALPLVCLFFLVAWNVVLRNIYASRASDMAKGLLALLSLGAAVFGGYIVLAVLCKNA